MERYKLQSQAAAQQVDMRYAAGPSIFYIRFDFDDQSVDMPIDRDKLASLLESFPREHEVIVEEKGKTLVIIPNQRK